MKYGITTISIVPCRAEPSDKSEQVTQLLFGECYKVIDERSKWVKVRMSFDKYEGWIDRIQHTELVREDYECYRDPNQAVLLADLVSVVKNESNSEMIPVVMGSRFIQPDSGSFAMCGTSFSFEGLTNEAYQDHRERVVETAYTLLNAPYLWGGRTAFGIDCSGFSQLVYKLHGVALPRDASEQAEYGTTLSFVEEAEPGDLAFFDNDEGAIIHVGILLSDNYIIHASGKVRVDRIDHQGIYNAEKRDYSHKLRLIKSIL